MVLSPTSTYGSCYSTVTSTLHFVSIDANTNSRLGDCGYIGRRGTWVRICNIFDLRSCQAINARPLQLSRPLCQYITQKQQKPLADPFVVLSHQAFWQPMEPDLLASRLNLEGKAYLELAASRARDSDLGLLICPPPNTESTAFIAGPGVFTRELHVPENVLRAWLKANENAVFKAARRMLKISPPQENGSRTISLATMDYATDCFRTLFIRTDANPSPVALGWRRKDGGGPGIWDLIEIQGATTVISGGFGSYPNGTEWTVGSNGLTLEIPSKVQFLLRCGCFARSCDEELGSLEPVPPPFNEKS